MVDFVKMLSHRKGDACTYRPTAGTVCLISGPHCDDENGYTYGEFEVLWTDDIFILYRKDGCWPVLNKWEHIRSKPLDGADAAPVSGQGPSVSEDGEFYELTERLIGGEVCPARLELAALIDKRVQAAIDSRPRSEDSRAEVPSELPLRWEQRVESDPSFTGVRSHQHLYPYVLAEVIDLRAAITSQPAHVAAPSESNPEDEGLVPLSKLMRLDLTDMHTKLVERMDYWMCRALASTTPQKEG